MASPRTGVSRAGTELAASGVRGVCRGGCLRTHGLVALRAQPGVVGGDHAELRQQRQPSARRQVRAPYSLVLTRSGAAGGDDAERALALAPAKLREGREGYEALRRCEASVSQVENNRVTFSLPRCSHYYYVFSSEFAVSSSFGRVFISSTFRG